MKKYSSDIERCLLVKLSKGDKAAFEKIYTDFSGRIYHFVHLSILNKQDAEGIVQDVFIIVWSERRNIDLTKSFKSFLYTIAKNKVNDYLRKVLQEKKYLESLIGEFSISDNDLEKIVNYRETQKVISELINLLPEKRKRAFELSRFQGKRYHEIAREMNISENTVDTHIRKALTFLREGVVRFSSFLIFF